MRFAVPVLLAFSSLAFAQGYSPEEAPKHMTLPEGFKAVLFASEPEIRQPVCIEFDDRGRLWCVQYLQYPKPAGLKPVSVDRWSRTKYDHIPEPPPKGPKGADVITILEDIDGDGHADTHKNFVEGLNLCSSIAFGYGGVFVLQVPCLLFYPDKDRDDVPDGDPEVLLMGFGMEDAHSVANSLTWGPDGWLYGTQGSTVTSNIRGIEFQQGVWRYHVEDKRFELFCEGGGNMWGLDFNEIGDCFASTNWGPYVMLHAEQGAYYVKSFGKHGSLHNPYAYGYFEHCTHHDAQGGHVANGGLVYQGGAYPAEFNGKYIVNNLLSHAIYYHEIIPTGSTYETKHAGTLLDSHDLSFAPSDLTTGPDGSLYVADWNDKRTAHPDPEAEWNKETGRIYKIVYGEPKPSKTFNLNALSANELMGYLDNKNYWFRRRARVLLAGRSNDALKSMLGRQIDSPESFWAAAGVGFPPEMGPEHFINDPDPVIRRWAVRLLGQMPETLDSPTLSEELWRLAINERDPHVRAQLASTAKRIPLSMAAQVIRCLYSHRADANDAHIPLLIWWAIEGQMTANPGKFGWHVPQPGSVNWDNEILTKTIVPRSIRRLMSENNREAEDSLAQMLGPSEYHHDKYTFILPYIEEGLQDRNRALPEVTQGSLFGNSAALEQDSLTTNTDSRVTISDTLRMVLLDLYKEQPNSLDRLRLAVHLDSPEAYAAAKIRAVEGPDRVAALEILSRFGTDDCIDVLFHALNETDSKVRDAGLDALKHFSDDATGARLLDAYGAADAALQPKMRAALLGKANWARAFLAAVDGGKIAADTVKADELRVVASHNDDAMNKLVEKYWGKIRAGTPEEKLAEMRRLNNELNFAKGDAAKGQQVFKDTCMKCHALFGEGGHVGPDLTQANRMDREFLLASLVDPSATVRKEYRQFTVTTKSLDVYNGVLGQGAPGTLTIYNANAEPTLVPEDQVDKMEEADLSLMPEDLLKPMNGDSVRDLFAYLQKDVVTK